MNESQIRDCLAAGHLIGSQSVSHRDLTRLSRQDANREIFDSKKRLEDAFGSPVSHFSYPYGAWNERTEQTVREAGYATAVTTEFGINDNGTNHTVFEEYPHTVRFGTRSARW